MRIVSLIASATEIVCALGLRSFMVGRSHECDFPADVKELVQCTAPKFLTDGTSYEIDQRVKAVLQDSLSVYHVDAVLLDSLAPTHIITQDQCQVCAVSLADVQRAACELIASQPQIISLQPNCLADVFSDIARVGAVLSIPERASDLVDSLRRRLRHLADRTAAADVIKPSVAFLEWIDPIMSGGNWMPELIEIAGGVNLFGRVGAHSPALDFEQISAADPEVIVVAPCGFDLARTVDEMRWLTAQPDWKQLQAVRTGKVFVADGNQFFNRPGPRLIDSAEILAEILHPQMFNFGYAGIGWSPFTSTGGETSATLA